jgi:hypothetical protein
MTFIVERPQTLKPWPAGICATLETHLYLFSIMSTSTSSAGESYLLLTELCQPSTANSEFNKLVKQFKAENAKARLLSVEHSTCFIPSVGKVMLSVLFKFLPEVR